jgi:hypothetical protein
MVSMHAKSVAVKSKRDLRQRIDAGQDARHTQRAQAGHLEMLLAQNVSGISPEE